MATVRFAPVLAVILILVLQSYSANANFTVPFFSPLLGNACEENVCGKGNCVASNDTIFGFECECEDGWKQARLENDRFFKFLPCIIPNCSLNYTCAKAPSSVPETHKKANLSFFDPCFWTDCGGGSCNKTSLFTHSCECEEDYYNLFNATSFPCYKQCAIGLDCSRLGLGVINTTRNNSSPNSPHHSNSHGNLMSRVGFGWLVTVVTTLTMVKSGYS